MVLSIMHPFITIISNEEDICIVSLSSQLHVGNYSFLLYKWSCFCFACILYGYKDTLFRMHLLSSQDPCPNQS